MRPAPDEYPLYFAKYIEMVPDGDIVGALKTQIRETVDFLSAILESAGGDRSEPGKWSIRETLGHIIDTERVFAFRALCFARGDQNALPGFEQDDYVRTAGSDARTLKSLIEEFEAVRGATVTLFAGLDDAAWSRRGVASQNPISVRSIAWILAGHELHHRHGLRQLGRAAAR